MIQAFLSLAVEVAANGKILGFSVSLALWAVVIHGFRSALKEVS